MNRRAVDAVAQEVAKEKAEALGLAGKKLEDALRELSAADDADGVRRRELVARAAERVSNFLVQREAYGFADASFALEHYAVPAEIVARLGIRIVT